MAAAEGRQAQALVIFDCDGVLIDSEVISAGTLIDALACHGVRVDRRYVARNFLGRAMPEVLRRVASEFGVTLPDSFEADYRQRLLTGFEAGLRPIPGVRAVLEGMRCPWCVATSSGRERAERSLEMAGLRELVGDRLFTASQVPNGKPAPDLFLLAAERMGVAPARCLVIEDSPTGLEAGRRAGMTVWHFTGGSHLAGEGAPEVNGPVDDRIAHWDAFFLRAPELCRAVQGVKGGR